jgi:RNA polymerase sigma factor (sigma-70 family)
VGSRTASPGRGVGAIVGAVEEITTPDQSDAEVYAECAKDLVRFATGLVGPSDAADVVSAAVVRCLSSRAWPTVRDRRAYLFRAVLNQARAGALSRSRREARERRASAPEAVPPTEVDPAVLAAVARLSVRQRAVVVLTYWADQDPASIAELLDVSEGTVRRHLARARSRLRRMLDA